jgi:membrane protease YdiL (CAAX protease family)
MWGIPLYKAIPYHPNVFDFALVVATLAMSVWEIPLINAFRSAIDRGVKNARTYLYAYLIALVWALAACVLALWFANGRPWSALLLGSVVPWRLAAGFALVTVGLWIALRDRATVLRLLKRPEVFERLRSKLLGPLEPLLPHTPAERSLWTFVSISAGVCEEIFARGFLLSLVAGFTGLIVAVPIAAFLFGLGHSYQGWSGILKTGMIGFVLTIVALVSGSLIPAMVLHFAIDYISGDIGYAIVSQPTETPATS